MASSARIRSSLISGVSIVRKFLLIILVSVTLVFAPILADIPANIGYYLPGIAVGKNSTGGAIYGLDVCAKAGMHTYLLWDGADGIQAYFCGAPGLVNNVPGATSAPNAHQMPACPAGQSVLYEFQYGPNPNLPSNPTKTSDLFQGAFAQACVPTPKCGQSDPTYCVSGTPVVANAGGTPSTIVNTGKWVTANSANCANGCCTDANASVLYCQALPPTTSTASSDTNACSTIEDFFTTKLHVTFDPSNPNEALAGLPELLSSFGQTADDLITFQGQTSYNGTAYYNGNLIPELKTALLALTAYYYDYDTISNGLAGVNNNILALSANYLNQLPTYLTQVWNPATSTWVPNTQIQISNPTSCNYSAAVPGNGNSSLQVSANNDAIGQLTARWLFGNGSLAMSTGQCATCGSIFASSGVPCVFHCFFYDGSLFGNPYSTMQNPPWPENNGHQWAFCNTAVLSYWLSLWDTVQQKFSAINICLEQFDSKSDYPNGLFGCVASEVGLMQGKQNQINWGQTTVQALTSSSSLFNQLLGAALATEEQVTFPKYLSYANAALDCCSQLYNSTASFKASCVAGGKADMMINACPFTPAAYDSKCGSRNPAPNTSTIWDLRGAYDACQRAQCGEVMQFVEESSSCACTSTSVGYLPLGSWLSSNIDGYYVIKSDWPLAFNDALVADSGGVISPGNCEPMDCLVDCVNSVVCDSSLCKNSKATYVDGDPCSYNIQCTSCNCGFVFGSTSDLCH